MRQQLGSPKPYQTIIPHTETRLTRALGCTAHKDCWTKGAKLGTTGFPLADFKYFLTLFSKFFASFPHGTCSLSVMSQYLALDGIYLPIKAAIPSNPTLQGRIVRPRSATSQDSHLLRYPVPRDFSDGRGRWRLSRLQFGGPRGPPDWRRELCPLHSPLLGASRLFSSPPLSDMLKFSG